MSSLSSIYHKVCPACASMRPREEERCTCGHSFNTAPADPELVEEQLYEDYLRARLQQIQQLLKTATDPATAAPLPRPEHLRAEAELRAVQAELDRQRARIERIRRSGKMWAAPSVAPRQKERSEGPRVVQAAEALAQELARLRRGQHNEPVRLKATLSGRAHVAPLLKDNPNPPIAEPAMTAPAPEAGPGQQTRPADAPFNGASDPQAALAPPAPDHAPQPDSVSPVCVPEPSPVSLAAPDATLTVDVEAANIVLTAVAEVPVTDAGEPAGSSIPAAVSAVTTAPVIEPVVAEAPPVADARAVLAEQGEQALLRQEAEAWIDCPNCTARFPKAEPRCKCGFEQPAVAALMPAVTLDPHERQRLAPLLKRR
ncbi:MAG: hypothetical protein ACYCQK_08920 [Acidiferrobacteraceae bacterium]